MNYPKGLDESGIMFFFRVVGVFYSSKSYSEFVRTFGREKNIWTKFLGQFGQTRPVDVMSSSRRIVQPLGQVHHNQVQWPPGSAVGNNVS